MTYLGIDGGGSKTTFLLVDESNQEISRVQTGPSNWLSVGKELAAASIRQGVAQFKDAAPRAVCAGFAGAGRIEGLEFYKSVLEPLFPAAKVRIESDAIVAYAGALGLSPGVLLLAGTGSIAIGRKADGSMLRVGGWGPHFGDEGGGFWIGREAIRRALRAVDSNESGEFATRVAAELGLASIKDVVAAWAAGTIGVPQIAALSPLIMGMWPEEPAAEIIRSAAKELRRLTETAVQRVGVANCSAAGSIANHPAIRQLIGIPFADPLASPEWGAVLLARNH